MKHIYRLWLYDPMDVDAIVAYLGRMARKGWRLEEAGWYFWRFVRAQPAPLTYAVTYFPGASFYGGATTEEQDELLDYCAAAGWTYVTQMQRMQIFVTDQSTPIPLETDEKQKLRTIEALLQKDQWRRRLTWAVLLLLAYTLIELAITSPLTLLTSSAVYAVFLMPLVLLVLGQRALCRRLWLRKSRQSVAKGGPCAPSYFRLSRATLWFVFLLSCAALIAAGWQEGRTDIASLLRYCWGLLPGGAVFLWWMRRRGYGERAIFWTPLLIIGAVALISIPISMDFGVGQQPDLTPPKEEQILSSLEADPVPLTFEDLGIDSGDFPISAEIYVDSGSLLASMLRCSVTGEGNTQSVPRLSYTIVRTSSPAVADLCLRDEELLNEELLPVLDDSWQAKAVYADRIHRNLLICWGNAILRLSSNKSLTLTEQQKAAVREQILSM